MSLRLVAASKTDVGLQREQNEDACYVQVVEDDRNASGLFIVADGMGGYHAGEVASRIAVETIRDVLQPLLGPASTQPTVRLNRKSRRGRRDTAKTRPLPESGAATATVEDAAAETHAEAGADLPAPETPGEGAANGRTGAETQQLGESVALDHYAEKLREAIIRASHAVVNYGIEHEEAQGLGSTVTAALVVEGQAFVANVGDSRTYLLRDGGLARVTEDHSLVERLVQAGQIEREDVYDHPNRNLIYRSLGAGRAEVDVDIFVERLRPGDVLLLGSDGLWEMVRDPQLEGILNEVKDVTEATNILIERANENGGEDNITAVLVRCVEA